MVQLLIYEKDAPAQEEVENRFGGLPLVPEKQPISWPLCHQCNGPMQFLGQLVALAKEQKDDSLILLFMCKNDPGGCDEWDSDMGGNCAISIPASTDMKILQAPDKENTTRNSVYGIYIEEEAVDNYEQARENWTTENTELYVLGQLFGQPDWIQFDQTPICNSCNKLMRFVAQLEEGPNLPPNHDTAMNFGGGCAYIFDCLCGTKEAKMLWQC